MKNSLKSVIKFKYWCMCKLISIFTACHAASLSLILFLYSSTVRWLQLELQPQASLYQRIIPKLLFTFYYIDQNYMQYMCIIWLLVHFVYIFGEWMKFIEHLQKNCMWHKLYWQNSGELYLFHIWHCMEHQYGNIFRSLFIFAASILWCKHKPWERYCSQTVYYLHMYEILPIRRRKCTTETVSW